MAEAKFRRVHFTDGLTGLARRFYALATKPVTDSSDGHSDSAEDVYLAAPGATRFRVKGVQGDYVTCRTWDGTTQGGDDILVAKAPALRHSLLAQTIDGNSVTFDGHTITGGVCKRVAHAAGFTDQNEYVLPQWQISTGQDSEIWAIQPTAGTGVSVGGIAVDWLDLNVDARAWCEAFPTALL